MEISKQEKEETARTIRGSIKDYPTISVHKMREEIIDHLQLGNEDFIVLTEYYLTTSPQKIGRIVLTKTWGQATAGFEIFAASIDDAISTLEAVIDEQKAEHTFIYFVVRAYDIPHPRKNAARQGELDAIVTLQGYETSGEFIRSDLYDW